MKSTTIRVDEDVQLRLKEFRASVPIWFESYNEVIKTLLNIARDLKADHPDKFIEYLKS